jgi:hypothetical protein
MSHCLQQKLRKFFLSPTTKKKQTCCFSNKNWSAPGRFVSNNSAKISFLVLHQDKCVKRENTKAVDRPKKKTTTKTKVLQREPLLFGSNFPLQPAISFNVECILKN